MLGEFVTPHTGNYVGMLQTREEVDLHWDILTVHPRISNQFLDFPAFDKLCDVELVVDFATSQKNCSKTSTADVFDDGVGFGEGSEE